MSNKVHQFSGYIDIILNSVFFHVGVLPIGHISNWWDILYKKKLNVHSIFLEVKKPMHKHTESHKLHLQIQTREYEDLDGLC